MGKKYISYENLKLFVDNIKEYIDNLVSKKANINHTHSISNITNLQSTLDGKALSSHSHSAATQSASGYMSKEDKIKLDNIASNANNYTLPSAGSSLGGVKTGGDVTISGGVIVVNDNSHNHIITNIDGLQAALDAKANTSHVHSISNITNLQSTLDGKASSSHTHSYLPLGGGTLTGKLTANSIFQNGRQFNNVATFQITDTVNEIVIKTRIPFTSGNAMPLIHVKGYAYGESAAIEFNICFYIYNDKFCNMSVVSTCPWKPNVYLTTYTVSNTKYVAINFEKYIYYPRFVVDYSDIWSNSTRDYSANWTVESKLASASGTIISTTDKVTVPYKEIANDISGNAATATKATTATTADVANKVAWENVSDKTNVTQSVSGLMSNIDKVKLDGIATGANKTVVDSSMSSTSTNPVQNKIVNSAINTALTSAKVYTDTEISELINGAPTTLDTLGEIATAMKNNEDVVQALDDAIGTKANTSDLTSHTGNKNNPHSVTLSQLGVTATASELNKMDGVTASTTELNILKGITATTTELNCVDGVTSNIQTQLNGKSATGHTHYELNTIGDNRSVATTPNTYSNKFIFQGLKSNSTIGSPSDDTYSYVVGLRGWSDSSGGNAHELAFNNTGIYTRNGSTTSWGAWNKIYTSANKPTPSEIGAAASSHNHSASNINSGTLSSDRLPVVPVSKGGTGSSTAAGALTNLGLTATSTELNYMDGVTSNVQTQLNGKSASGHTHSYAGSSSAGGAATSANKLNTNAGSATQPVYFSNGVPVATTYSLSKSVPADAKFTDTNTWRGIQDNLTSSSTTDSLSANQGKELKALIDGKAASSHNHAATNITSGTLSSDRLPTVPISKGGTGATSASAALTNLGITATASELNKLDGVTATTAELNHVDGVTSNIQTQLNGKAASSHTHSDTNITWSGTNVVGGVSPLDTALSSIHNANRLSFAKPAGITIEYTTDGSNWIDYAATDAQKINLVSGIGNNFQIGKSGGSSSVTTNYKLRITLNAVNMGVYTRPRKMLINVSTGASKSQCLVEYASLGTPTTFTTLGTYQISGWSGWNSIPLNTLGTFGGGSTQTSNRSVIRLTFNIATLSSTANNNFLNVSDIVLIGDTYWSHPSAMAKTGHLYSWDSSQNATFPANITATAFNGNATTATTATKLGTNAGSATQPVYFSGGKPVATTYALNKTVPSDAKFTDTVYTHPTTSGNKHIPSGGSSGQILRWSADGTAAWGADNNTTYSNATTSAAGLMSSTDKSKLDGIASGANKYTLPAAGSVLGGVKSGGDVTISNGTITVNDDSHNHTIANVDGLQTALDVKSDNDHRHYAINISVTGHDLNNYTDAGTYTFTGGAAVANAPSGNTNGWLIVIPWHYENATIKQLWFRHGAVGTNDFETFVRTKVGSNNWGSWSKFYTTSNPPTAAEVGASASNHNHNSAYISKSLQMTTDDGNAELQLASGSSTSLLTKIAALDMGMHTFYSASGNTGNPKTTEAWRGIVFKTGTDYSFVQAYGSIGSVYTNYLDGTNGWRGWKCVWDVSPAPLWSGAMYMSSPNSNPQTVTPSKKLSECRNGWLLLWSDYDPGVGANDADFVTTMIPKRNPTGGTWGGKSFLCDIPCWIGSDTDDVSTEKRIIKPIYVHDDCIKGSYQNDSGTRNDVVLRAVYEY